jgi:hypothetical protein
LIKTQYNNNNDDIFKNGYSKKGVEFQSSGINKSISNFRETIPLTHLPAIWQAIPETFP